MIVGRLLGLALTSSPASSGQYKWNEYQESTDVSDCELQGEQC